MCEEKEVISKEICHFLVIQADGVAHWGTTDKMTLIVKQREVLGFHSFLWKTTTVL